MVAFNHIARASNLLCGLRFEHVTEETFLQDFVVILKRILKKCFLVIDSRVWNERLC